MKRKRTLLILAGLALICLSTRNTSADERILDFDSRITVHRDAGMAVTETIRVRSEGDEIRHGIYRDFPTTYQTKLGLNYRVGFKVIEVLRDGRPESYHFENLPNGQRVYLGKKQVELSPGEYTYTLTYETDGQVGFFKNHDELYWNVTGNDWNFLIERAAATLNLPPGAERSILELGGYTGPRGARARNFTVSRTGDGAVRFATTDPLFPREGFTIYASWPKGYVEEPAFSGRILFLIRGNRGIILGLAGLIALTVYYLLAWVRVGRDPARGTIIPRYGPPRNFSPALVRYISRMGFDDRTMAAALINMAVKGYISLSDRNGVYTVSRGIAEESVLSREEKKVARQLLGAESSIELKRVNHRKIGRARDNLKKVLRSKCKKIYFITNIGYSIIGLILSIAVVILSIVFQASGPAALFSGLWLTLWSIGVVFLFKQCLAAWKEFFYQRKNLKAAIFSSLFALPFFIGEGFGLYLLTRESSFWIIFIMAGAVFVNYLFYHLLKAPTRAGRKILDMIEGFKMFLAVAEKERLNLLNPPEKTPELFEKFLPYALALGVEQDWAEKFSEVLARAGEKRTAYQPAWYSGASWARLESGAFASSLGTSLAGAVTASATAPGSSSGGGGGGFSGGGGGGGGGGGW